MYRKQSPKYTNIEICLKKRSAEKLIYILIKKPKMFRLLLIDCVNDVDGCDSKCKCENCMLIKRRSEVLIKHVINDQHITNC